MHIITYKTVGQKTGLFIYDIYNNHHGILITILVEI